jgi:hypothetical protein
MILLLAAHRFNEVTQHLSVLPNVFGRAFLSHRQQPSILVRRDLDQTDNDESIGAVDHL